MPIWSAAASRTPWCAFVASALAMNPDGRTRRPRWGHDEQRCRIARMPTTPTAKNPFAMVGKGRSRRESKQQPAIVVLAMGATSTIRSSALSLSRDAESEEAATGGRRSVGPAALAASAHQNACIRSGRDSCRRPFVPIGSIWRLGSGAS
jgi:hypothetical protein